MVDSFARAGARFMDYDDDNNDADAEADGDDNDNDGQVGCWLLQHQRIEITL